MKTMILAAGRGERLRPMTDTMPKSMVLVDNKPLLSWHFENLQRAGFTEIILNTGWCGDQIESFFQDGRLWQLKLTYSSESRVQGEQLGCAGGVARVLSYFNHEPFLLINADVWSTWDYTQAKKLADDLIARQLLASIVVIPNPAYRVGRGDFSLDRGMVSNARPHEYTYSGIGVYHPDFFSAVPVGQPCRWPLELQSFITKKLISGHVYAGDCFDVGTPQRLQSINNYLKYAKRYSSIDK